MGRLIDLEPAIGALASDWRKVFRPVLGISSLPFNYHSAVRALPPVFTINVMKSQAKYKEIN
jgi:hypothetical protein